MSDTIWIVWDQLPGTGPEEVFLPKPGASGCRLKPGVPSARGADFAAAIMERYPNVREAAAEDFAAARMELPAALRPKPAPKATAKHKPGKK